MNDMRRHANLFESPSRSLKRIVSMLFAMTVCFGSVMAQDSPKDDKPKKPLLLAFYHPWYGTPWGPTGKWKQWSSYKFPEKYHPEKVVEGWRHDIASGDYPLMWKHSADARAKN
jgi:hypothetical protein